MVALFHAGRYPVELAKEFGVMLKASDCGYVNRLKTNKKQTLQASMPQTPSCVVLNWGQVRGSLTCRGEWFGRLPDVDSLFNESRLRAKPLNLINVRCKHFVLEASHYPIFQAHTLC